MRYGDTIAAISSASGPAARMILRLSGPEAAAIAARSVDLQAPPPPASATRVRIAIRGFTFAGWLYYFRSPRSYSGEDLIEFHIPGNPLLAKLLLEELLRAGARAAEPGEFTARAYFNERLDLTEAEGVAATIAASNEQELAAARRLFSGELARRVAPAVEALAGTLALLEVGIDFSDEDVSFLSAPELIARIDAVDAMLAALLGESTRFERLSHEPTVVLVGRPNAGKSTLLNALAGHDRAVVSPVAGTTRDALSAEIALSRGIIRLIDIAGLEEQSPSARAGEEIDAKMRDHAMRALQEADWLLLVRDITDSRPPIPLPREPDLLVLSKADLPRAFPSPDASGLKKMQENVHSFVPQATDGSMTPRQISPENTIRVSAPTGEGLGALRSALESLCFGASAGASGLALTVRHVQAVEDARAALARSRLASSAGPEYVAQDLREALDALGQITGRISSDDLLGRIFSAFCIGK